MLETKSCYEILDINEGATQKEIKTAYRKLAKRYHPDCVPPAQKRFAEEKFKEIAEAYYIIGDTARREMYSRDCRKSAADARMQETANYGAEQECYFEETVRHPDRNYFGFLNANRILAFIIALIYIAAGSLYLIKILRTIIASIIRPFLNIQF
jgi:DnaJ-class molecular chaperone